MIKKVLSSYYFEILIYLISIIIIFILLYRKKSKEEFKNIKNNNKISVNNVIYSIIPSSIEEDLYYASYFSKNKSKKRSDNDNLVYTNDLSRNRWKKMPLNSKLDKNTLIIDLNYDENKKLIAIGLSMIDNEPEYNIFIKETSNVDSKWVKVNSNKKMRSICYDINSGKLIGINSYDGQIYENRIDGAKSVGYTKWVGPINYDKPMKKILFNRYGILIGIGLIDNYIYKKTGKDWKHSEYDEKNINKTKVYDIFYDKDGCMIASTPNGIMKQLHQDFNSEFINIRYHKEKHEDSMNKSDILKSRVGVEFIEDELNTSNEFGKKLKEIYEFKKISKKLCNNKMPLMKYSENGSKIDILSQQNREINDLYSTIDEITGKMNI